MENPADWNIPTGTTGTAPAHTGTPVRMNTVVVLGDSLSDIGQMWTTKSGRTARATGQMYVSPTGRFSDCRNWTDFMFEAACGQSLVSDTANGSIALSQKHFSYSPECGALQTDQHKRFWYANYAAGGACGDTPAQKADFLGTCKEQVDGFELDCMKSLAPLGNTLFIIWFGANDLYTAGCQAEHMAKVASVVASEQRARLLAIFKKQNAVFGLQNCVCKFIFVDLARPLTSVRYTKRLQDAEVEVKNLLGPKYKSPDIWGLKGRANNTLSQANWAGHFPGTNFLGQANAVEALRAQIAETKRLEKGVLLFNACLESITIKSGDRVAHIGICISEDTIRKLVGGGFRLKAGALSSDVKTHISAQSYNQGASAQHIVTKDEVHPTDQMYKLIWLEIYEQIKQSGCTFGSLVPSDLGGELGYRPDTPLTPLSQERGAYGAVMRELLATRKPSG